MVTGREATLLARAHAARVLMNALAEGWPDPDEYGYTRAEWDMIQRRITQIARGLDR